MAAVAAPRIESPSAKLIAPSWHTALLVALFLGLALGGAFLQQRSASEPGMLQQHPHVVPLYLSLIVLEWGLFYFIWKGGLGRTGTKLSQLIGGKWAKAREVLLDASLALGLWAVWIPIERAMDHWLGPAHAASIQTLLPQRMVEILLWIGVSISAGICALWGPLHGGANQEVVEMLEDIRKRGLTARQFIDQVKDKKSGLRLMGFGHRVYKNFDPRAKIIKKSCDEVLQKLGIRDPMLDLAKELEDAALRDPYFVERKLYPNVDFYSGIIYRALGIPTQMFTVMFALGRLPGWIAHWKEMIEDPNTKIARPRQIYTGPTETHYVSLEKRV